MASLWPGKKVALFVGLAVLTVLGIAMVCVASFGLADSKWTNMLSLLCVLLVPAPIFVGRRIGEAQAGSYFGGVEGTSPALELGYFVGAALFTSAVLLPPFLWHTQDYKNWLAALLSSGGVVTVTVAIVIYYSTFHRVSEDIL